MTRGLQVVFCALLLTLTSSPAWGVCRPENRVWKIFSEPSKTAAADLDQNLEPRGESAGCGYDFASGVHKYLYAEDDPVDNVDPSGHDIGDMLAIADIFTSFDAIIQPTVSSVQHWSVERVSLVEGSAGKKCVPWVSTWLSDPENDQQVQKAIRIFDRVETFERVMTLAALITVNQELGMAAAIDEAGTELGQEGVKVPLHFGESLVNLMDEYHGNLGYWTAWTGVPRETTVPGFFWDSKVVKWKWRRNTTGGADEKGSFAGKENAWKAAAHDCKTRIDSGDL